MKKKPGVSKPKPSVESNPIGGGGGGAPKPPKPASA